MKNGKARKVDLMLDSGAFSAWNRGETLSLKKYIRYVARHQHLLFSYVNMDVLPGTFGQKRTQKDVEHSAKQGYDNQQEMKSHGLSPIPVFHQGESFSWLEQMLKDGETYIGISSAKDLWKSEQQNWLDDVFSVLTTKDGRPIVKTHGFGITRVGFIMRYPWYSVDSTTWSLGAGFGHVLVPKLTKGVPDYNKAPIKLVMSGVAHTSRASQRRQFENYGPDVQESVRAFLETWGMNIVGVRYDTSARRESMLRYYEGLSAALPEIKFRHHSRSLFAPPIHVDGTPIPHEPLRIVYATSLNREWGSIMNKLGCRNRLLSYYEIQDRPTKLIEEWVMTGNYGTYVKKRPKSDWTSEAYRNYRRLRLAERVENGGEHDD